MSAFVVDAAHIDVILSAAVNGPTNRRPTRSRMDWHPPYVHELTGVLEPLGAGNASRVGELLIEECIASVTYRYPDLVGELPGPMPTPLPEQYEWTDLGRVMSAIEACKAIACFEYQAETALGRAPRSPAGPPDRAHKRTVRVGTRRSLTLPRRLRLRRPANKGGAERLSW